MPVHAVDKKVLLTIFDAKSGILCTLDTTQVVPDPPLPPKAISIKVKCFVSGTFILSLHCLGQRLCSGRKTVVALSPFGLMINFDKMVSSLQQFRARSRGVVGMRACVSSCACLCIRGVHEKQNYEQERKPTFLHLTCTPGHFRIIRTHSSRPLALAAISGVR